MAKQTKTSKSTTTKTGKRVTTKPQSRGERSSKPPVAAAVPVVVQPPKPDSVLVVSELRETAEILDGLRSQRDELRAWMAETVESLAELRRQRADIGDLAGLKRTLEAARSEFEALHQEAKSTRQALAECRTADRVVESRTVIDAAPSQDGQAESAVAGAILPADGLLPEGSPCPAGELPIDVSERLVRYLNDAWIIEKEETDLLQTLAEAAPEPKLKAELEEHRILSQEQQHALRERLRALGTRPSGGRSFVGMIATHVWDAIQYRGREADDTVEVLLKATSAVELEAAIYMAVYSLARAVGDEETASLAGLHLKQERDFADRLRKRLIEVALRPSTAPVA